jgi:hypothetical protein
MKQFLDKLRTHRAVLQRTKSRNDLPKLVFYVGWLASTSQRRVLDQDGQEHVIADRVLQSHYKQVSGTKMKALIAKHWAAHKPEAPVPASAPDSKS